MPKRKRVTQDDLNSSMDAVEELTSVLVDYETRINFNQDDLDLEKIKECNSICLRMCRASASFAIRMMALLELQQQRVEIEARMRQNLKDDPSLADASK